MSASRLPGTGWWQRKERRRFVRRRRPPLILIMNWWRYPATDWSLGGCRIEAAPGVYKPGEQLDGTLDLVSPADLQGTATRGAFVAEVMHASPSGMVGLRWLELSDNIAEALRALDAGPAIS
jgi:hypothetical protein